MQLGFVIDQSRCIGCHACTVACKAENGVPVGSFRTWVKYTEQGAWPEVKRSFSVLRCNQCTDAPCVAICPVSALDKRDRDGIVDIDPAVCIGCKACLQGCPYDALYLNEDLGTVQKCHFCAHRVENDLAPACAIVCPTEAIIPGDFHDPASRVSRMREEFSLSVRKEEAGTGPNVMYRDASPAGLDPTLTSGAGGYLWSQRRAGETLEAELWEAMEEKARPAARTVYSVDRSAPWGGAITGYLFFKSLAAGIGMAGSLLLLPLAAIVAERAGATGTEGGTGFPEGLLGGGAEGVGAGAAPAAAALPAGFSAPLAVPALALLFLTVTLLLLVVDLKRPERFWTILARPNWNSWLAKGSFIISGYGVLLTVWLAAGVLGRSPSGALAWLLLPPTVVLGALSAMYTGWLFRQAKGRVLWMKRGYPAQLLVQALLAGSAALLLLSPVLGLDAGAVGPLGKLMLLAVGGELLFALLEGRLAPPGREAEYHRVARLVSHGPYARTHWLLGVLTGLLLPGLCLLVPDVPALPPLAGALALLGLWFEKDVFVRAGQALPIS